jgi:hypothetical protein
MWKHLVLLLSGHEHLTWDLMFEKYCEWQGKQDISNVVDANTGKAWFNFLPVVYCVELAG